VSDKINILVVDDRPENLLALRSILSTPEQNVVSADSGAEALKALLRHDFAVILLDVIMPGMDGFETARLIRQRERSLHVPIIFLTANVTDINLIYRAYSIGAVDYLVKPVDADVVRAKVAVFVDLFRKGEQIRRQEEQLREAERQRSAAALEESEAQYQATFQAAPIGIGQLGVDSRWLRVNQRLCEILGYAPDELLGLHLQDVTHPEHRLQVVPALAAMLQGRLEGYRREQRYLHKDGSTVWVNLRVSMVRDAARRPRCFIAVVEDVTERRRAEAHQRFLAEAGEVMLSSLDFRATLAQVARLAVPALADWCVVDIAGEAGGPPTELTIAHADPARAALLHDLRHRAIAYPDEVLARVLQTGEPDVGEPLSNELLAHAGGGPDAREAVARLGDRSRLIVPLAARGRVLGAFTLISADAGWRYGSADLAMAEELAHRAAFAVENAQLYRSAQEAIAARDEFLSIASHELRTPLTPLQIQLQRLLRDGEREPLGVLSPERVRTSLRKSERQVQRLGALIDNLLDVSRITRGRLRLQLEEVDLAELVRDVVGRFGDEIARSTSLVEVDAEPPVRGRWDRLRLEQVVTNLLANALKYGEGKPIEIRVRAHDRVARLTMRDHGIGVPLERQSQIFNRFERAVSARTYGGLGLGLYIAKQILDAHGGSIGVASRPGEGSVFTVELPVEPALVDLDDATAELEPSATRA
jgi:PAS domain S-box-containing protein